MTLLDHTNSIDATALNYIKKRIESTIDDYPTLSQNNSLMIGQLEVLFNVGLEMGNRVIGVTGLKHHTPIQPRVSTSD